MIWSLSTRTCKQMKVRNKHWYRFCHSKPTMVFIPMPIQKFEYKSLLTFLSCLCFIAFIFNSVF